MTPPFAEAVDPIFQQVLGLLDRIGAGASPSPEEERLRIRGWIDVAQSKLGQGQDWQLAKYAVVTWVDEVLSEANWPGRDWWNENAFEVDVFNTRLANEQFYVRAKEAGTLARKDALEVFYVCVVLGFRGLYRDPIVARALAEPRGLPADLEAWAKQTSLAIRLGQGRPTIPEAGAPGLGAPPLSGQTWFVGSLLSSVVAVAFTVIGAYLMFLR